MKAWKKLAALVMALGMTVAFAACGGGNDGGNGGSSSEAPAATPEQLTESEMRAAINALYETTNISCEAWAVLEDEGETMNVSATAKIADGKIHQVSTREMDGETSVEYSYAGEVDGVLYMWNSIDNQNWSCMAIPEGAGFSVSAKIFFEEVAEWINYTYFDYNTDTGMHEFTNWGINTTYVKVVDGKIVEYKIQDATTLEFIEGGTFTYGNATVGALPPVTAE